MYRLLVLSVAVAAAVAGPLSANDKPLNGCVSWDANIRQLLFTPIQEQLQKYQSEYIQVSDEQSSIFGIIGVEWKNGKAGNFSSLQLNAPASQLCTTNNNNTKTLTVNLGFTDLYASFDVFSLFTPMFTLGGGKTSLSLKGENLLVVLSATTDPTTKNCAAELGTFLFNEWGALELEMGDGILNMLLSKIFNLFISTRIIEVLETFGVDSKINGYAAQYLNPVLAEHSDLVCGILNSNL